MTWLIAISAVFCVLRVLGLRGDIFKDAAHFWVGCLAGAWWVNRGALEAYCFIVLCVVELACFFYFRRKSKSKTDRYLEGPFG